MEILQLSNRLLMKCGGHRHFPARLIKYAHQSALLEVYPASTAASVSSTTFRAFATETPSNSGSEETGLSEEFRPLDIVKSRSSRGGPQRKRREKKDVLPPRYLKMPTNQDWPSVWPTARTFHPASVPLPMHQGYVQPGKGKAPPNKFANLELMKIANFLHLTPPAIKRHCEAIKKFCTPWPEELKDDYLLENLFPIEIVTNDYCHSSPSIRDPKARIVTLKVKVSFFKFDDHAKDKFLRLVGDRYDPKTDELTLVTDCCPLKRQNYDYSMYLLTALYHESWSTESWEGEKAEEDMEKFVWEGSKSQESIQQILGSDNVEKNAQLVDEYKNTLGSLLNQGETTESLSEYGDAVRKLLNLPPAIFSSQSKIDSKQIPSQLE